MLTTALLFKSDYRVICILDSDLENYDGKYDITVYLYGLMVNSQYICITVWTVYCPLLIENGYM